jgi:Na+-transporting methylmalonyl-CoA/oxaloacetate decarboxylase gamma subunit
MSPMSDALIITVIGMGLVFIAIVALWGLMELMVRVTARYSREEETEDGEEVSESAEPVAETTPEVVDASTDLKRKAAAAAVVLALAQEEEQPEYAQVSSYSSGSAWQAVSRGGQLNQRATLYSRKSRGN